MKKIRLFLAYIDYDGDYHYYSSYSNDTVINALTPISDWIEVTDEEYNFLYNYRKELGKKYNAIFMLVEDTSDKIPEYINDIKGFIKKEQAAKKRYEEQQKTSEAKRLAAKEAREKKRLEQLKAKYEAENV